MSSPASSIANSPVSEPVQKSEEQVSQFVSGSNVNTAPQYQVDLENSQPTTKLVDEIMHNGPFMENLAHKDSDYLAAVANNPGNVPGAEMYLNHETHASVVEPKPELPESSVKRSSVINNVALQQSYNRALVNSDILRNEPIKTSVKRDILDNIRLKRLTKRQLYKLDNNRPVK